MIDEYAIEQACRLIAEGKNWDALETLRRECVDGALAQTISECQQKVERPWR